MHILQFFPVAIRLINISAAVASVTLALIAIALRKIEHLHLIVFVLRMHKSASSTDEIEVLLNWAAGLGVTAALPPLLHAVPPIAKASVKSVVVLESVLLTILAGVLLAALIVCGEAKVWLIVALVLITIAIIALVVLICVKNSEFDSSLKKSKTILHVFIILTIATSILSTILIILTIIDVSKSEMPAMWTMSLTLVCFSLTLSTVLPKLYFLGLIILLLILLFGNSIAALVGLQILPAVLSLVSAAMLLTSMECNRPKWLRIIMRIMIIMMNCILIYITASMMSTAEGFLSYLIRDKVWHKGWLALASLCTVHVIAVANIILCVCMCRKKCHYPVKFCYFQVAVTAVAIWMIKAAAIVTIVRSVSALNGSAFEESTLESNASCVTNLANTKSAAAMRNEFRYLVANGVVVPINYKSFSVDVTEMHVQRVKAQGNIWLSIKTEEERHARFNTSVEVSNLIAELAVKSLGRFNAKLTANPVTATVNAEMMSNGSPLVNIRVKQSFLAISRLGKFRQILTKIADFFFGLQGKIRNNVRNNLKDAITRSLGRVWPAPVVNVDVESVRISWNSK